MLKATLILPFVFASLVSFVLGAWLGSEGFGSSLLGYRAEGTEGNAQGEEAGEQQQNTFNRVAYALSSGYNYCK